MPLSPSEIAQAGVTVATAAPEPSVSSGVASTVQAVSAVVTTIVTIVLAVITNRYVKLTKAMADTAAAQLTHTVSAASRSLARDAARLAQVAESLLTRVRELPMNAATPKASELIRSASLWTDDELQSLVSLAGTVGEAESANAAGLLAPMGWLAATSRTVKAEHASQGFAYSAIDWNRWTQNYNECHSLLGGLFTLAGLAREEAIASLGSPRGTPEA